MEKTSSNVKFFDYDYLHLTVLMKETYFKESQKKRILDRHGDQAETIGLMMAQMFDLYEKPGEGEKNTYNVDITEGMTPKDVLDKVLEVVNKNCE